jgi:hypothetical protein
MAFVRRANIAPPKNASYIICPIAFALFHFVFSELRYHSNSIGGSKMRWLYGVVLVLVIPFVVSPVLTAQSPTQAGCQVIVMLDLYRVDPPTNENYPYSWLIDVTVAVSNTGSDLTKVQYQNSMRLRDDKVNPNSRISLPATILAFDAALGEQPHITGTVAAEENDPTLNDHGQTNYDGSRLGDYRIENSL